MTFDTSLGDPIDIDAVAVLHEGDVMVDGAGELRSGDHEAVERCIPE